MFSFRLNMKMCYNRNLGQYILTKMLIQKVVNILSTHSLQIQLFLSPFHITFFASLDSFMIWKFLPNCSQHQSSCYHLHQMKFSVTIYSTLENCQEYKKTLESKYPTFKQGCKHPLSSSTCGHSYFSSCLEQCFSSCFCKQGLILSSHGVLFLYSQHLGQQEKKPLDIFKTSSNQLYKTDVQVGFLDKFQTFSDSCLFG